MGAEDSGATLWSSSPKLPSRVATFFGFVIIAPVIISAASSGVIVGKASYILVGAIIGVRTSGMWMVVMWTPSSTTSEATQRDQASSAALEATYAEKRGVFVCTPIELMLMM